MITKKHLIQSIFIPTLCYQCQTWTLTANQKRKLVTTEMRCLRKATGVTIRDRVRNDEIRKRVGIEPITYYIERQQIKWFAHMERLPCESIPYKAFMKRGNDRRAPGRPRKRWIDNIREILQTHQMTLNEATTRARARTLYLPRHPNGYKRK